MLKSRSVVSTGETEPETSRSHDDSGADHTKIEPPLFHQATQIIDFFPSSRDSNRKLYLMNRDVEPARAVEHSEMGCCCCQFHHWDNKCISVLTKEEGRAHASKVSSPSVKFST